MDLNQNTAGVHGQMSLPIIGTEKVTNKGHQLKCPKSIHIILSLEYQTLPRKISQKVVHFTKLI